MPRTGSASSGGSTRGEEFSCPGAAFRRLHRHRDMLPTTTHSDCRKLDDLDETGSSVAGAVAAARAGGRGVGVPVRVLALDRGDAGAAGGVAREAGALEGLDGLVGGCSGSGGHVGAAPVPDGAVPGVLLSC